MQSQLQSALRLVLMLEIPWFKTYYNYQPYTNYNLIIKNILTNSSHADFSIINSRPFMTTDIWLEKYRPKNLDDIYGNQHIVSCLKQFAEMQQVQHLILTGPPGVGKTSSVLCLARAILGDKFSEAVKEMNASDDRGIDVVRHQIKQFTQKTAYLPPGQTKIMILDEADSLTEGAQQALRMIISNSNDTRFVLSCNDSTKLIAPIQSRCVLLKFKKLKDSEVQQNLKHIIEKENVKISPQALQTLIFISEGDMRQSINNLQACHQAVKNYEGGLITKQVVINICDVPNTDLIKEMFRYVNNREINRAIPILNQVFKEGHSTFDIVNIMYKVILQIQSEVSKQRFMEIMKEMAELKKRVFEGLTSEVQVAGFLAKCCSIE